MQCSISHKSLCPWSPFSSYAQSSASMFIVYSHVGLSAWNVLAKDMQDELDFIQLQKTH